MDNLGPELVASLGSLCGVIIGSALTFLLTLYTQRKQREWALQDQQREWAKERLEKQMDSVLQLLGESLAHLRLIAEGLRQGRTDLAQHAAMGVDTLIAATIASLTVKDADFAEALSEYATVVSQIRDLYERAELTEQAIHVHLEDAQAAAQKVGARAQTLLAGL
jgi:uncharacterized membrane-anchored protein YhcB (DUF1043 family)